MNSRIIDNSFTQAEKNIQITNDELRKLNQTSEAIAAANAVLVTLQSMAVSEAGKQTKLLDAQLQISKINDLEKDKQNQLKRAAFSIDQEIKRLILKQNSVEKYFLLRGQQEQVILAALNANAPNEIADKQYVSEVLTNLEMEMSVAKSSLTNQQVEDVEKYYAFMSENSENNLLINFKKDELKNLKPPKKNSSGFEYFYNILLIAFGLFGSAFFIFNSKFLYGISTMAMAGAFFFLVKKSNKEDITSMAEYDSKCTVIKSSIQRIEEKLIDHEEFYAYFKKNYSLP